jgi:hypothetical protein
MRQHDEMMAKQARKLQKNLKKVSGARLSRELTRALQGSESEQQESQPGKTHSFRLSLTCSRSGHQCRQKPADGC